MKIDDILTSDKAKISNAFCSFFATISSTLSKKIISMSNLTWKPFDGRSNLKDLDRNSLTFRFNPVKFRDVATTNITID